MKQTLIVSFAFCVALLMWASTPACVRAQEENVDVVPAYVPPAEPMLAPVKLPPIKEKMLKNGLKVIVVVHHELPVISLRLVCKAGSVYDPPEKAGITQFMANLINKGSKNLNAKQIADKIDFVGGSLGAGSGWDATYITCEVLSKYIDTGIELLQEVTLNPAFSEDEIERLRKQTLSGIEAQKDDPSTVATENFDRRLFGKHPYANPIEGTEESVGSFTRQDVVDQYRRIFLPENSVLFVVGDIGAKEGFKLAERALGGWSGGTTPSVEFSPPNVPEGYRVYLVNKPDATQTQIRLGHLGIARNNEDYFAVMIMNYILGGGGFSSRLTKVIRAEEGLTYGIRSSFSARLQPGPFTISTFTKNESTLEAIQKTIDLVKKFQQEGPTETELEEAKSYYSGSYPLNFETPNQIASQLQDVEIHNLGSDYIEKYRSRIEAVTAEDVIQAARKYIHPDDMVFVVVSKASDVLTGLETLGSVQVTEIE